MEQADTLIANSSLRVDLHSSALVPVPRAAHVALRTGLQLLSLSLSPTPPVCPEGTSLLISLTRQALDEVLPRVAQRLDVVHHHQRVAALVAHALCGARG